MPTASHVSLQFPSGTPALWGSLAVSVGLKVHLHKGNRETLVVGASDLAMAVCSSPPLPRRGLPLEYWGSVQGLLGQDPAARVHPTTLARSRVVGRHRSSTSPGHWAPPRSVPVIMSWAMRR